MRTVVILILAVLTVIVSPGRFASPSPASAATIIYVNDDAAGANDGTSWANAFRSLRGALDGAVAAPSTEIWVAAGTYRSSASISGRNGTFRMRGGIDVYGSFAGVETSREQRSFGQIPTSILTGAIGAFGTADDAYHVVTVPAAVEFVLDGFTVTAGNADGAGAKADGAGVYFEGDTPDGLLTRLVVAGNDAANRGGGAYVAGDSQIEGVRFTDNRAMDGGGAYADDGNPQFIDVTFDDNRADNDGGGLTVAGGLVLAINTTFRLNDAAAAAAINVVGDGDLRLTNSTIARNTISQGGNGDSAVRISGSGIAKATIRNTIASGSFTDIEVPPGNDEVTISDSIVDSGCPDDALCLNLVDGDAELANAVADNGGFVPTVAIEPGSAAIDAANEGPCPNSDARGVGRPFDGDGTGGAACDIGAFEYISLPTIAFGVAAAQQQESNAASGISVVLSHPYPKAVTVDFEAADGTATSPADYDLNDGVLVIPPNTGGAFNLSPGVVNDNLDESNETFTVTLSNPQNAILAAIAVHTRTILDDDDAPAVSFRHPNSNGVESRSGEVEVLLSAPSAKTVKVNYAFAGGTATRPADYTLAGGTLTFAPGATSRILILGVVNDGTPEPTETVRLELSTPVDASIATPSLHVYRIRNDDQRRTCFGKKVTLYGTDANDAIDGSSAADVIFGGKGRDTIRGLGGKDTICGAGGRDTLRGGAGADLMRGGFGGDRLLGGPGNDTLNGEGGPDTLRGESGNDTLSGGPKRPDVCDGGAGVDALAAGHGCERVSGVP